MNLLSKTANATDNAIQKVHELVPYGKAERLTAGLCMGIPFFLMIAGISYVERSWWWFSAEAGFFVVLPFLITYFAGLIKIQRENHGIYLTMTFSIVLILLYLLFRKAFHITALESISAYVAIPDSFIFGLLLTVAAMLFTVNGLVYWDEYRNNKGVAGRWRGYGNVVLGLALEGVVLFPCTRWPVVHLLFAGTFFVGCAAATVLRSKKRTSHKWTDFLTAIIMAMGFAILGAHRWLGLSGSLVDWVTIFGAESVGLWVIGIDFILVSLKR